MKRRTFLKSCIGVIVGESAPLLQKIIAKPVWHTGGIVNVKKLTLEQSFSEYLENKILECCFSLNNKSNQIHIVLCK